MQMPWWYWKSVGQRGCSMNKCDLLFMSWKHKESSSKCSRDLNEPGVEWWVDFILLLHSRDLGSNSLQDLPSDIFDSNTALTLLYVKLPYVQRDLCYTWPWWLKIFREPSMKQWRDFLLVFFSALVLLYLSGLPSVLTEWCWLAFDCLVHWSRPHKEPGLCILLR